MPSEYQQQWDEYNEAHQKAEDAKSALDDISKRAVGVSPESRDKRREHLATIRKFFEMMRAKEEKIVGEAKGFADQNNTDNIQMYLDAYNEYFDYLGEQENISDEHIQGIIDSIDALNVLLKNQGLVKTVSHYEIPEEIKKQASPEELEKIKTLLPGIVLQNIADLDGQTPEAGFNTEKLNQFTLEAAALSKQEEDEPDTRPRRTLFGPVKKIIANPGWTGHAKYKNQ